MSKLIQVILLGLLTALPLSVIAATCESTNQGLPFRQVVLYFDDGVRCDYGNDPFDFSHSYEILGSFKAVSGPWSGASQPNLIYCRTNNSNACVFEKK